MSGRVAATAGVKQPLSSFSLSIRQQAKAVLQETEARYQARIKASEKRLEEKMASIGEKVHLLFSGAKACLMAAPSHLLCIYASTTSRQSRKQSCPKLQVPQQQ